MDYRSVIMVFAGGGLGAVIRLVVDHRVRVMWPDLLGGGVLLVNLLGCLAIGGAVTVMDEGPARVGVIAGLLGGLTTFSSFGLLLDSGIRAERWAAVGAQLLLHLVCGVVAVRLGVMLGRLWLRT